MSRILITGNMGYVGSVLVPFLRKTNHHYSLIGADAGFFIEDLLTLPAPEIYLDQQYFYDIRDIQESHLQGIDTVIHLAAVSNDPMGNNFEQATNEINANATIRLGEIAKKAGVRRFIFASSCSIFGDASQGVVDESSPPNPLTTYAKTKIQAEQALAKLAAPEFQVSILRFGTACGYSPRLRLDLAVNDFLATATTCHQVKLLSAGNAWRPFIHVEDMCRAIFWALSRKGEPLEVVNVGSDVMTMQIRPLAELVCNLTPGTTLAMAIDAPVDKRSYNVSFSKYQRLAPDFQPRWDMTNTIQHLKENLAKAGFNDQQFRAGKLIRLNKLRQLQEQQSLTHNLRWTPH